MKALVRLIGVVSKEDKVHAVEFGEGVNVITGSSSKGKSAMIEIFDYCFGSSEFTVPPGKITDNAEIYFIAMELGTSIMILARKRETKIAFFRELSNESGITLGKLNLSFFSKEYFFPLDDFKKLIGLRFNVTFADVDESRENRKNNRKSATPSIRSFMSLMLQHQNLIANKHAIFYRFDQSEKREQLINHFKIFMGMVDQSYFLKSQELEEWESKKLKFEKSIPKKEDFKRQFREGLGYVFAEYAAATGKKLDPAQLEQTVHHPNNTLDLLRQEKISLLPSSDEHSIQREGLEKQKGQKESDLRKLRNSLSLTRHSIAHGDTYLMQNEQLEIPTSAEVHASNCPFCQAEQSNIEQQANRLSEAIDWLNNELRQTPSLRNLFKKEEAELERKERELKADIIRIQASIDEIDNQTKELESNRSQYEIAVKAKLRLEFIVEKYLANLNPSKDADLQDIQSNINRLKKILEGYNIESKIHEAESTISKEMNEIGEKLDFEGTYQPINLKFDLETFDLWHEGGKEKIFLRAMGSGANWLYSHICLFLALHRYFCSLGSKCSIPSILFIDQPSQVYFPSIVDSGEKFDHEGIRQQVRLDRSTSADEDLAAVANLYSQLVKFCASTLKATGIEPQIIVTDHADNLILSSEKTWDEVVNGRRWRTRGFIQD